MSVLDIEVKRLEKRLDPQTQTASKNSVLPEREKLAQDAVRRKAEADRLITESQELFAQQKAAAAIQLLRQAYELDKKNALARTILANALVEHAQSIVDTDWLQAETLANQALALNPAHPTAKTILNLIVDKKEKSSVDDWVSQAQKLHSSGDLFAALAWVAEGLAVHPHDSKLLQIQDAIQRDQETRRRQARRGDLEELRRLQQEIAEAKDTAAKQSLADRIQGIAAKHWTDGEILSIANALLLRLGMLPQENSAGSARRKGGTVIFHVPRPSAAQAPPPNQSQVATSPGRTNSSPTSSGPTSSGVEIEDPLKPIAPEKTPASAVEKSNVTPAAAAPSKIPTAQTAQKIPSPQTSNVLVAATSVPAVKVTSPTSLEAKQPKKSNFKIPIFVSAAVIVILAAIFFFGRKHQASPTAKAPETARKASEPTVSAPAVTAPSVSVPEQPTSTSISSDLPLSSEPETTKVVPDNAPAEPSHNAGKLLIVTGQDNATVSLNGKPQRQITKGGQLLLQNLEPKDYVVKVSKSGFQDPPQQTIHIGKSEEARLVFNLEPQPHLSSLTIQGGAPGTAVFIDQTPVGSIQADGALSVSTVNPGDHVVELRKDRFKVRQIKKHFVAGGATSLGAADVALEAAPAELKITFAPADANVAVVKGEVLKIVSSGVPLNLAPGTYTLTARTADRFTRSATLEIVAGQPRNLDLSLAPNGMSKWQDPGGWKHEGDSFVRKGGDFVLYGVVPASGTFVFSAMPAKGHLLQWVLNYTDPKNYVLFQMDDSYFYRTVIRNGQKVGDIRVSDKGDRKSLRTLHILVSSTEIVHQVKHGDSWTIVDRWTQPGVNLGQGKFGFYIPGSDQVELSGFAHYADLDIR